MCFVVGRQGTATVQAVLNLGATISEGMITFSSKIPNESIIEIVAQVVVPDRPIKTCTQQVELQVKEIWCLNKSAPYLPFQIEDASRLVLDQEAEDDKPTEESKDRESKDKDGKKMPVVKQDVRLNNRIIDLRVPAN